MSKDLKFNIKNAQLAEVLQLKKPKKKDEAAKPSDEKTKPKAKPKVRATAVPKSQMRQEEKKAKEPTKPAEKIVAKEEQTPTVEVPAKSKMSFITAPSDGLKPGDLVKPAPKEFKKPESTDRRSVQKKPDNKTANTPNKDVKKPVKRFFEEVKDKDKAQQKRSSQVKSFDSRDRMGLRSGDEDSWRRRRNKARHRIQEDTEIIRPSELTIKLPISVKDLAQKMKYKAAELIQKLFMQGLVVRINDVLDDETTVGLLGHEFSCNIIIDRSEEERLQITDESIEDEIKKTDSEQLEDRPPIIAFMGHVDHGKTSLIDAIRKSHLASQEAGAITQHIGAFTIETPQGRITVLDTPGHEAFTAMRERGAKVTDLVILVVAGDEGLKAQTDEAIKHAKQMNVPILVAVNKKDKEGFNTDNVYRQLSERELLVESWGGEIVAVPCSAKTGEGIQDLLEMTLLQTEVLELKASPEARARGTIIESQVQKGLGITTTLLIQNGTLHQHNALVIDHVYGRVKTMHNDQGKKVTHVGPGEAVKISGLSGLPDVGSEFVVVSSEKEAKKLCEDRLAGHKHKQLHQSKPLNLEDLLKESKDSQEKKVCNVLIKADVQGSLDALETALKKLPSDKVALEIVKADVGAISESDIEMAVASDALIIGFHTSVESHADPLIKTLKARVKTFDIIYHLVDAVKEEMTSKLDAIRQETHVATARVQAVFKSSHLGNIAGCIITDGTMKRTFIVKVKRGNEILYEGDMTSLKRVKEDVKEVAKGIECGILINGFQDIEPEDEILGYEVSYLKQEL